MNTVRFLEVSGVVTHTMDVGIIGGRSVVREKLKSVQKYWVCEWRANTK